jgi:hypothetical protein
MNWIKYYPGMDYTFDRKKEYLVRTRDNSYAVCDNLYIHISSDRTLNGYLTNDYEYIDITHFIPCDDLEAEID